jgi:hypothetical protein
MIEAILGILIVGALIFILIKAVGNILKGIFLIFLAFLIYYLFSSSIQSLVPSLQPIGNFLKTPIDKVKSIFYNIEIVAVTQSKEDLVIVVRNSGLLPLTTLNVKIDGKDAKVINNISILLPKQVGVVEVDWKGNYYKIEVFNKEVKATYVSPL